VLVINLIVVGVLARDIRKRHGTIANAA